MKTTQYIQTLMFTLDAASAMTKEQMLKSHATITAEEPCFGLAPKDKRTRATLLEAFKRQIAWMVNYDHAEALEMDAEIEAARGVFDIVEAAHAEALEINAGVDLALIGLAHASASLARKKLPAQMERLMGRHLIEDAVGYVGKELGARLSLGMVPELVARLCK